MRRGGERRSGEAGGSKVRLGRLGCERWQEHGEGKWDWEGKGKEMG